MGKRIVGSDGARRAEERARDASWIESIGSIGSIDSGVQDYSSHHSLR